MRKILKMYFLIAVMTILVFCAGCNHNKSEKEISTTTEEEESGTEVESDSTDQSATTENATTTAQDGEEQDEETTTASVDEEEPTTDSGNSEEPTTTPDVGGETSTVAPGETVETPTASPSTGGSTSDELATLVNNILAKNVNSSMSQMEKVLAIHDYLTYNVDYDYDNYLAGTISGDSYSALGTLKYGKAVCSGYAYAFYELAKAAGIEVKFIPGVADNGSGNGYQGHAWNQVKIDGVWYNVDTTWDDPTYVGKDPNDHSSNGYGYFLISDATLEKDHIPDSGNKATCPKDYDRGTITKAIAGLSKNGEAVYAGSASEISGAILSAINSGNEEFVLYMNEYTEENWNLINRVFTDNKKPYRISNSSIINNIVRYYIEKDTNVYCVSSVAELKTALDNNKNRIQEIQLWFYDDELTESNMIKIVNAALVKAGYSAELFSRSDVMNGMIKCYVTMSDKLLIVNNTNELVTLIGGLTREELQNKTIMYTGDSISSDEIGKIIYDATVPKGYYMLCVYSENYEDITQINMGDPRDCIGIDSIQDIADMIKAGGVNSVLDKDLLMYVGDIDTNTFYYNMIEELKEKTGYDLYITYNYSYKYMTIMVEGLE